MTTSMFGLAIQLGAAVSFTVMAQPVLLENITLVDVKNLQLKTGQTVTIDADTITALYATSALGLPVWFHPTIDLQRAASTKLPPAIAAAVAANPQLIQPGDLLHVDFGFSYLRLNSDQQQHAYVLRPGETAAPAYLQQALANSFIISAQDKPNCI